MLRTQTPPVHLISNQSQFRLYLDSYLSLDGDYNCYYIKIAGRFAGTLDIFSGYNVGNQIGLCESYYIYTSNNLRYIQCVKNHRLQQNNGYAIHLEYNKQENITEIYIILVSNTKNTLTVILSPYNNHMPFYSDWNTYTSKIIESKGIKYTNTNYAKLQVGYAVEFWDSGNINCYVQPELVNSMIYQGIPSHFTESKSIRIWKGFDMLQVTCGHNRSVNSYSYSTSFKLTNVDATTIALNLAKSYPKLNISMIRCDFSSTTGILPYGYKSTSLSSVGILIENGLVYDGEDDFYVYFHIDNFDAANDNILTFYGIQFNKVEKKRHLNHIGVNIRWYQSRATTSFINSS